MKTNFLFFWTILILITTSCEESTVVATEEEPSVKEETVDEKVTAPTVEATLEFEGDIVLSKDKSTITGINIRKKGEAELFQKIEGLALDYMEGVEASEKPTFEDLNFDGYVDLMMPETFGNANVYYVYWIFDAAQQKLVRNTEMTLSLPNVDIDKKQISSFERESAAESHVTIYSFIEGKFEVVREESREWLDEKTCHLIVNERQADGTMKEVQNEEVKEE